MKNIFYFYLLTLTIGMMVGVSDVSAKSQLPCERTTEDEVRQKDHTGFIPQAEGWFGTGANRVYLKRRNLTVTEIADYAFGNERGIRVWPKINPSNEGWNGKLGTYRDLYAQKLKEQIVYLIRLAEGENLSEAEVEKIFRSLKPVQVTSEVKSTGLKVDSRSRPTGEVAYTITRCPYVTKDGLGEQMVEYEGSNGIFRLSLVCGNSFEFEEKKKPTVVIINPPKPKPEPEKIPTPGVINCPPTVTNCPWENGSTQGIVPSRAPGVDNSAGTLQYPQNTPTQQVPQQPSAPIPNQNGWSPGRPVGTTAQTQSQQVEQVKVKQDRPAGQKAKDAIVGLIGIGTGTFVAVNEVSKITTGNTLIGNVVGGNNTGSSGWGFVK